MKRLIALSFHLSAAAAAAAAVAAAVVAAVAAAGGLGVGAAASTTTTLRTYSLFIKSVGKGVTVNDEYTRERDEREEREGER